jgi:UbiD family decarboxylase
MRNLRQFIQVLRERKEIIDIHREVDPDLELAEIHRRIAAENGPALFFHKVKNSPFPVVTNLFGSTKRIDIAFHNRPEDFIHNMVQMATKEFPPSFKKLWTRRHTLKKMLSIGIKRHRSPPVTDVKMAQCDLEKLPFTKSWPLDGGGFLTLPLVYTEPPGGGPHNLGIYRIQRYDKTTTGLHWQIGKGGGFHHHQAELRNESLPVSIFLGGPPALILSAIAPLPENVPELMLASLLQGEKLGTTRVGHHPYPIIGECEFALLGSCKPHERRLEGPFGDHYGYYSWAHDFPVFDCEHIYHRKDAIFPATVVGKPRQEDYYIGDYLQKLLSPLFPVVMSGVRDIWSYGETGFHSLAAACVHERYERECMTSAFRILGEGQLSLTKFLLLTDQPTEVKDIKKMLTTVLERFKPETDLFIFSNLSLDTLDYTGPSLNKGSRGIMLGTGKKIRDLPTEFQGTLPQYVEEVIPFCPGCLLVQIPAYGKFSDIEQLSNHPSFAQWPLLILVDDAKKTGESAPTFLWTVFTRFEPAADIYSGKKEIHRHHLCYSGPIAIDARMKPSYPPEVECDPATASKVSTNWSSYF